MRVVDELVLHQREALGRFAERVVEQIFEVPVCMQIVDIPIPVVWRSGVVDTTGTSASVIEQSGCYFFFRNLFEWWSQSVVLRSASLRGYEQISLVGREKKTAQPPKKEGGK